MHTGYGQLRELLRTANFTEEALEARFRRACGPSTPDQLDVLRELFLRGESVSRAEVESVFPPSQIGLLLQLRLIELDGGSNQYDGLVSLYPVGPLWIQSDRMWKGRGVAADVVFSAISPNTQDFLAAIPMRPCRSFLELCGGTGTAALLAALNGAGRAASFDICPRSVQFAKANCLLNGLEHVEVAEGDLWEPARGRQFDFIVAHPPYVPALRPAYVFRDGGMLGDDLLRRIVEGLPAHLQSGGRFYSLSLIPEREGRKTEQCVREWLGEASGEFDVFLIIRDRVDARTIFFENWSAEHNQPEDIEQWKRVMADHGVTHYTYAELIIERRREARAVATARRYRTAVTDVAAVEWMIEIERSSAQPEWRRALGAMRLHARPGIAASVAQEFDEGEWRPRVATLHAQYPFRVEAAAPAWIASYLKSCNGDRTVRSQFLHLQHEGTLSGKADENDFFDLNTRLIAGGFVEAETLTIGGRVCQEATCERGDRSMESSPATAIAATTSVK